MARQQLKTLMGSDVPPRSTGKLGARQRQMLMHLCEGERAKIASHSGLDGIGQPFFATGAKLFRSAVHASLLAMEQRGLLLRQDVAKGIRSDSNDPHGRTTHVQLLPAGRLIGDRLIEVAKLRQQITRDTWGTLSYVDRCRLCNRLVRWCCRTARRGGASAIDRLVMCPVTGDGPSRIAWMRVGLGRDELLWLEHEPKLFNGRVSRLSSRWCATRGLQHRQQQLIAYLAAQSQSVQWKVTGPVGWRTACHHSLRKLERRKLIACSRFGNKRNRVRLLDAGREISREIERRAAAKSAIERWDQLTTDERETAVSTLIRWKHGITLHSGQALLAVLDCLDTGASPIGVKWVSALLSKTMRENELREFVVCFGAFTPTTGKCRDGRGKRWAA